MQILVGDSLLAAEDALQGRGRIRGAGFGQRTLDLLLEVLDPRLLVGCELGIGELIKTVKCVLVFLFADKLFGTVNESLGLLLRGFGLGSCLVGQLRDCRFDLLLRGLHLRGCLADNLRGCGFCRVNGFGRRGGDSLSGLGRLSLRGGLLFLAAVQQHQAGTHHDFRKDWFDFHKLYDFFPSFGFLPFRKGLDHNEYLR